MRKNLLRGEVEKKIMSEGMEEGEGESEEEMWGNEESEEKLLGDIEDINIEGEERDERRKEEKKFECEVMRNMLIKKLRERNGEMMRKNREKIIGNIENVGEIGKEE